MSSEVMQVVLMGRARVHGPMLGVCPVPGCSTITMGGTCVQHDLPVTTVFPRGRPYTPAKRRGEFPIIEDVLRDIPA
jgi:hypothetical protein